MGKHIRGEKAEKKVSPVHQVPVSQVPYCLQQQHSTEQKTGISHLQHESSNLIVINIIIIVVIVIIVVVVITVIIQHNGKIIFSWAVSHFAISLKSHVDNRK